MSQPEERFSLTLWRGQWAHLPLVFAPFVLTLPLTFAGISHSFRIRATS